MSKLSGGWVHCNNVVVFACCSGATLCVLIIYCVREGNCALKKFEPTMLYSASALFARVYVVSARDSDARKANTARKSTEYRARESMMEVRGDVFVQVNVGGMEPVGFTFYTPHKPRELQKKLGSRLRTRHRCNCRCKTTCNVCHCRPCFFRQTSLFWKGLIIAHVLGLR
jgi:hypothetical protein